MIHLRVSVQWLYYTDEEVQDLADQEDGFGILINQTLSNSTLIGLAFSIQAGVSYGKKTFYTLLVRFEYRFSLVGIKL